MHDPMILTPIAIGFAVLAALWFGPFATLRRDNYRSDIRRMRDELFDFMLENGFSFDLPIYRDARQTLNGMLRWSNGMSAPKFLVSMYFISEYGCRPKEKVSPQKDCNEELRKKIEEIQKNSVLRTVEFMFNEGTAGLFFRPLSYVNKLLRHPGPTKTPSPAINPIPTKASWLTAMAARQKEFMLPLMYNLGGKLSDAQQCLLRKHPVGQSNRLVPSK